GPFAHAWGRGASSVLRDVSDATARLHKVRAIGGVALEPEGLKYCETRPSAFGIEIVLPVRDASIDATVTVSSVPPTAIGRRRVLELFLYGVSQEDSFHWERWRRPARRGALWSD